MILNRFANTQSLVVQQPLPLKGNFKAQLRDNLIYKEYSIQNATKRTLDNIKYLRVDPQTYYKKPFEESNTILTQEASALVELGKSFNLKLDQSTLLGNPATLHPKLSSLYQDRAIADLLSNHKVILESGGGFDPF